MRMKRKQLLCLIQITWLLFAATVFLRSIPLIAETPQPDSPEQEKSDDIYQYLLDSVEKSKQALQGEEQVPEEPPQSTKLETTQPTEDTEQPQPLVETQTPSTYEVPAVSQDAANTLTMVDVLFADPLPQDIQPPELQDAIQQSKTTSVATQSLFDIDSLNYHEPGYARFYIGYFLSQTVFAINDKFMFFADWKLSFLPAPSNAFRKPKFGLKHQTIQSLSFTFYDGETEILQCHEDFRQSGPHSPCLVPATLSAYDLSVEILAVAVEGLTYEIRVKLEEGLSVPYEGSFKIDQLASVKVSHHPYRVNYIAGRNWYTFIAPLNNRFHLNYDFGDHEIILNISSDKHYPNHLIVNPLKEEALDMPFGYPFQPNIIHPRTHYDIALQFHIDAGLTFAVGTESSISSASIFPLVDARFRMHLRSHDVVQLYLGLEKSFFNTVSGDLFSLSNFEGRIQVQYEFKRFWLRPEPIFGLGYYEFIVQTQAAINPAFSKSFLPSVYGLNIFLGVNLTFAPGLYFRIGVLYALLTIPTSVNLYARPELGLSYFFTPNLGVQLLWKGFVWRRTPTGGIVKIAGTIQDFGLFLRYNI